MKDDGLLFLYFLGKFAGETIVAAYWGSSSYKTPPVGKNFRENN